MKTAIITDSTFYMNQQLVKDNNIIQVPLQINFDDKTYKEDQYNLAQTREIFDYIDQVKLLPKTSQPSATDWEEAFKKVMAQGCERILVFTVSIEISGTYQGAVSAANMFMEEHPVKIEVYDSKSDGQGSALVLYDIIREMNKRELSQGDITEIIDWHEKMLQVYLLVDDLKYLAYGGRIPQSIARLGNMLRVKPIIYIPAGKLVEHSKPHSRKKALASILEIFKNDTAKYKGTKMYFSAGDLFDEEQMLLATNMLIENAQTELEIVPFAPFGPVIGAHIGPGTIAFGWTVPFSEKDNVNI